MARFQLYKKMNFSCMWVIHSCSNVAEIHMLEAALIAQFHPCTGCQNQADTGGEGALNRKGVVPPFFLYVTGGRADQNCRVG